MTLTIEAVSTSRRALGEALQAWRARVRPEDVALSTPGGRRRVAGLRREELATLAGVSASYYTRLEQGESRNASPEVLNAIARALRLSDVEREHLHTLAATQDLPVAAQRTPPEFVDPALAQLLTSLGSTPGMVLGRRCDVLAWNIAGHALLGGSADRSAPDDPDLRPNFAEMIFLDPRQRELYRDWETKARSVTGSLRQLVGRHPDDLALVALVRTLSQASAEFVQMWSDHEVESCETLDLAMRHPRAGDLTVTHQALRSLASPDQLLLTCTAPAGSSAAAALARL